MLIQRVKAHFKGKPLPNNVNKNASALNVDTFIVDFKS